LRADQSVVFVDQSGAILRAAAPIRSSTTIWFIRLPKQISDSRQSGYCISIGIKYLPAGLGRGCAEALLRYRDQYYVIGLKYDMFERKFTLQDKKLVRTVWGCGMFPNAWEIFRAFLKDTVSES
jgi:hypothetical protein